MKFEEEYVCNSTTQRRAQEPDGAVQKPPFLIFLPLKTLKHAACVVSLQAFRNEP